MCLLDTNEINILRKIKSTSNNSSFKLTISGVTQNLFPKLLCYKFSPVSLIQGVVFNTTTAPQIVIGGCSLCRKDPGAWCQLQEPVSGFKFTQPIVSQARYFGNYEN